MANKTISELNTATLSDSLVMVVEGAAATEKTTVASLKEYIQEGVSIDVDSALSTTSENPVQNKVITTALNNKVDSSSLASVATSGAYSDLTGTPTIPAAQIQSDWNQTDNSALDYIKNKPTIPAEVTESTVSGWGFTKNEGTVVSVNNIAPVNGNVTLSIPAAQVQADWNETDSTSMAYIANKPSGFNVDQTYNPISANAQSGVAIAGAGFLTQHQDISGKQDVSNLVTSLSASSTDTQYPSAKCVYDMIGDIEAALATI